MAVEKFNFVVQYSASVNIFISLLSKQNLWSSWTNLTTPRKISDKIEGNLTCRRFYRRAFWRVNASLCWSLYRFYRECRWVGNRNESFHSVNPVSDRWVDLDRIDRCKGHVSNVNNSNVRDEEKANTSENLPLNHWWWSHKENEIMIQMFEIVERNANVADGRIHDYQRSRRIQQEEHIESRPASVTDVLDCISLPIKWRWSLTNDTVKIEDQKNIPEVLDVVHRHTITFNGEIYALVEISSNIEGRDLKEPPPIGGWN